jgi:hypothetical protein
VVVPLAMVTRVTLSPTVLAFRNRNVGPDLKERLQSAERHPSGVSAVVKTRTNAYRQRSTRTLPTTPKEAT